MTFKTKIKKVKQEVVTECTCDKCGNDIGFIDFYGHEECKTKMEFVGVSGFILKHTGSYYSSHDCETETLVLCDECFFELVKEIKSKK